MEAKELLYLLVLLLTARWWLPSLRRLLREAWEAGEEDATTAPTASSRYVAEESGLPLQRANGPARPAGVTPPERTGANGFRRTQRSQRTDLGSPNLAMRRGWEGGFGRRGL